MDARPPTQDLTLLAIGVLGTATSAPLIAAFGGPALAIAFWRTGAAAAVIAPLALLRGRGGGRIPARALRLSLLPGLTLALPSGTFIPSLSYTSVASAGALVCTQAVWAGLLGLALGERMPRRAWIGVGVSLLGVLLITGVDFSLSGRALLGDGLALAGGVFGGAYIVTGSHVRREVSTASYTAVCYGACATLLLTVCLFSGQALTGFSAADWL